MSMVKIKNGIVTLTDSSTTYLFRMSDVSGVELSPMRSFGKMPFSATVLTIKFKERVGKKEIKIFRGNEERKELDDIVAFFEKEL